MSRSESTSEKMSNENDHETSRLAGGTSVCTTTHEYEYYYVPRRTIYTHCVHAPMPLTVAVPILESMSTPAVTPITTSRYHLFYNVPQGYAAAHSCEHVPISTGVVHNCCALHRRNAMNQGMTWPRQVEMRVIPENIYEYVLPSREGFLVPYVQAESTHKTSKEEEDEKCTPTPKKIRSSNVYRAEEGYLVEEPDD